MAILVTWNPQKAFEAADAPKKPVRVDNFSYVLAPGPGDAWNMKAFHFPQDRG